MPNPSEFLKCNNVLLISSQTIKGKITANNVIRLIEAHIQRDDSSDMQHQVEKKKEKIGNISEIWRNQNSSNQEQDLSSEIPKRNSSKTRQKLNDSLQNDRNLNNTFDQKDLAEDNSQNWVAQNLRPKKQMLQKAARNFDRFSIQLQPQEDKPFKALKSELNKTLYGQCEPETLCESKQLSNAQKEHYFQTHRSLQYYDCWEEETPISSWIQLFKSIRPPHAVSPIYITNKYRWTPVEVLGYDQISQKFKVRILVNDNIKEVIRISLKFLNENAEKFQHRLNTAKERQKFAENELRLLKYVDSIEDSLVSLMSEATKKRILSFVRKPPQKNPKNREKNLDSPQISKSKYKPSSPSSQQRNNLEHEADHLQKPFQNGKSFKNERRAPSNRRKTGTMEVEQVDKLKEEANLNMGKGKQGEFREGKQKANGVFFLPSEREMLKELQSQSEYDYKLYNKKFYVLKQMENPQNDMKWIQLRIEKKILEEKRKLFGTIEPYACIPELEKANLQKKHYSKMEQLANSINLVIEKSEDLHRFSFLKLNWNEGEIPVPLGQFQFAQQHQCQTQENQLKFVWRDLISSTIQDFLREKFSFYITEHKQYVNSDLQPFLKKIDLIMSEYYSTMLHNQLNSYAEFIARFNYSQNLSEKQVISSPLIIMTLTINTGNIQKKKKKKDFIKYDTFSQISEQLDIPELVHQETNLNSGYVDHLQENDESEQIISYDPSISVLQSGLLQPLQYLVQVSGHLNRIQKDLMTLLELPAEHLFLLDPQHEWVLSNEENVTNNLDQMLVEPLRILSEFRKYDFLMKKTANNIMRHLIGESKSVNIMRLNYAHIADLLKQYENARQYIQRICRTEQATQIFLIRTSDTKMMLEQRIDEVKNAILHRLNEICVLNIHRIQETYQEVEKQLQIIPKDEKEWAVLKETILNNEKQMEIIHIELEKVYEYLTLMENYQYSITEQDQNDFYFLMSFPKEIQAILIEAQRNLQAQEDRFLFELDQEKEKFKGEVEELFETLEVIKKFNKYSEVNKNSREALSLSEKIEKCVDKVKKFNESETTFKLPLSPHENLQTVQKQFAPYYKLWEIAMEFELEREAWCTGSFVKQSYSAIEKKTNQVFYKETIKLQKLFNDAEDDNALTVVESLKKDIENFRHNMWIFEFLTTDSMRNLKKSMIHWREIFKESTVVELEPSEEMSFNDLLKTNLKNNRTIIEEISKKSEKQFLIEKKLKEMEDKVKGIKLEMRAFKLTGSYVLKGVEEIQQILDEQLNILLMMKSSPYIKQILKQALQFEQKMILIQDTLDQWIKCQRGWMYLEPIFASEDIKKKMEKEKNKFDQVDQFWRQSMENFLKDPNVYDGIENEKLKNEFTNCNKILDQIQKSLSEYLETKRRYFPRFFFLSDEELIEILADTKDPLKVQKHINKCFEAINQLEFQSDQNVVGMISSERETVKLQHQIDVNEGDRKGNVEKWLLEIEKQMIATLKMICTNSFQDVGTERTKWIQKWPGQVVLAVNMIRWTQGAEQAINDSTHIDPEQQDNPLQSFYDYLNDQLKDLVDLVRKDIDSLTRMTLGAMVVLDVHAKDVILELVQSNCSSLQDFAWISQLRYYFEERKKGIVIPVKMINAVLNYGFEYLGNSARLVITPLTDRCYRTLMGAFHLSYGGAPEGPAGTGKTETVKDLAKSLAFQCVVFNCSDGLNYLAMRKFFKGLASSGAWCCFDEFNRIDLEVLSVIAQQVLTIQTAIKEKKKIFQFEGEEIALITTCAINITMNPGYAGRSELPDNLKALFRPCAMMVPDYALIAEIYLYSVGFQEARGLAKKIVVSLRLSSEQLSSQDHYDFGMRALKAILTAGGNLKRVMQEFSEDIVCLRALMDVNLPKFTINDVPLFLSITSDLFPGVSLPEADLEQLLNALKFKCQEVHLQPEKNFLTKCIQLFDTINVRHGLMVVGQAFSGKTSVITTLKKALTSLAGSKNYVQVEIFKLNPKAITSDQLYGKLDPDTKSWSDGVIAIIMRQCAQDNENPEKKWIVFDGPVDAVWIENMNTVLDDNKKLCLTSGEIIKMSNQMTMMFEVEDLQSASPATVSRCGMVFLEAKQLGWEPLIRSYFQQMPPNLAKMCPKWEKALIQLVDYTLAYAFRHTKFQVHKSEMNLVWCCLKLISTQVQPYLQEDSKNIKEIEHIFENIFLFSIIWSICVGSDETTRHGYTEFFKELFDNQTENNHIYVVEQYKIKYDLHLEPTPLEIATKFPFDQNHSVFEMLYDSSKQYWIPWTATIQKYTPPKNGEFHSLIVPIQDSIRNSFFLHLAIQNQSHLLICGPTGTGKTINITTELNIHYFNQVYTNLCTAFSGQTNANQVQKLIESKVSTRKRKGYFGPEEGKKFIVIFIDDLNMPQKEKYGAQPPIELLRQWMDEGGWYDLETKEFKYLQDITFVTAMLPPTGGRNFVSMRYLRHFQLLYVEPFQQESLVRIFTTVMEWFFSCDKVVDVSRNVKLLSEKVVQSTIELYQKIQTSKELLPTPTKSHYIYNLRDIAKVFQGISQASHQSLQEENDLIKLWAHECMRVFQDRLINLENQAFFDHLLQEIVMQNFKKDWNALVTIQPLLWASFIPTIHPDGDTTKKPLSDIYCELTNREALSKKCYEYLEEFNNCFSSARMNLVLFTTAIQHIIKIIRVITTTFGHSLLVGVGGSGRKSLSQLSSFIAFQNDVSQVDARNWSEELQKLLKNIGLEQKPTVFLFSDTQILNENIVQDICNLLNNGEIPNLFPPEEKQKIIEEVSSEIAQATPNEKYKYFVQKCRENLHLVLAFSPIGESFRSRLRVFPSLVNCTTIDWFLPWPEEALRSTANNHFLNEMQLGKEKANIEGLVDIAVDMQLRVTQLTKKYYDELRRYYYVTPTSFLELLNTFKTLKSKSLSKISGNITRYEQGVNKILQTEDEVAKMQVELENLQPVLIEKTKENTIMLTELQKSQKEADQKKEVCQQEEQDCNLQREKATALKEDCQNDLDKVLPLLAGAAKALDNITTDDMTTLKSFTNPPEPAQLVMEGLCYAFDEDQHVKMVPVAPGSMEKKKDFWDYAKKKLLNNKLITRVKDFKEDKIKAIPEKKVEKLKEFMQKPIMKKEIVFNASKAAGNLSLWMKAVVDTYDALLVVEPKRLQLQEAQTKLQTAEAILAEKKQALKEVMDLLDKLQSDYQKAKQEKEDIEYKINKCVVQIDRAGKLLSGLSSEKVNWKHKCSIFKEEILSVIGDSLLCASVITYLGAFPILYRESTIKAWQNLLETHKIVYSKDFSIQKILCDLIQVGQWTNQNKLPNDNFSIDSAIILKNSNRWPLMIDPQIQANQWIKNMESNNKLLVFNPSTSVNELQLQLESAIQYGFPVLFENAQETFETVINQVLQKNLIKQGTSTKIKFGDQIIDYSSDFNFYVTTKLPRPHYSPEICIRVTLLNFQVTIEGLEDQMLNIVVKQEEPSREQQRQKNIIEFFDNKEKQRKTEDMILRLLNEAKGDLLDDEVLIETLQKSKIESQEIEEKLKKQEYDRETFNIIRNYYKDVAVRVANLYFIILDLSLIEPTYQWSLEYYINIFFRAIEAIQKAFPQKDNQRCTNIMNKFQLLLYQNTCRSLLEKDKLIFSFLIWAKIMEISKQSNPQELRFFTVGGTLTEAPKPIPENLVDWLSNKQWCTLCELSSTFDVFKNFDLEFTIYSRQWRTLFDKHQYPFEGNFPSKWQTSLSVFQKLIVTRVVYPNKMTECIQKMLINELSEQFVQPPPFNLDLTFQESTSITPLIFILSSGADPRIEILNLAELKGCKSSFLQISLGQGQSELAEKMIKQSFEEGNWILLQNCHLAPSFMPILEKIFENLPSDINENFRLWLTSMPSEVFPASILMKGIKMTFEQPRGLKNSLLRSFMSQDRKQFEECEKPEEWKKLFFGLAFFHAVILERRKFGPLGWNIPYEFTAADFTISYSQLKMFLNEFKEIPWSAMNYMVAEANYGGRVTDPMDRRLINILLKTYYTPQILQSSYKFCQDSSYFAPEEGSLDSYIAYIQQLPRIDNTEVYGLHSNAEISSAILETNRICSTVLSLLPRTTSQGGMSTDDIIKEKIAELLSKLPRPFDIETVTVMHPVKYEESMNTVLQQEVLRFNKLLNTVVSSLQNLAKAIEGLLVMSLDFEQIYDKCFNNQVPEQWQKVAYPSLKPLGSWINDLAERLEFMRRWIDNGIPKQFWISGFFFTQSFLTGVMQNYSRKYTIPIDQVSFKFQIINLDDPHYDMTQPPLDGAYVDGLFLDGARWNEKTSHLDEPIPKMLFVRLPVIWLIPTEEKEDLESGEMHYYCPAYKTSRRAGTLSTTGHSTNYVLSIWIPLSETTKPQHWAKRGVAALTQLDD